MLGQAKASTSRLIQGAQSPGAGAWRLTGCDVGRVAGHCCAQETGNLCEHICVGDGHGGGSGERAVGSSRFYIRMGVRGGECVRR